MNSCCNKLLTLIKGKACSLPQRICPTRLGIHPNKHISCTAMIPSLSQTHYSIKSDLPDRRPTMSFNLFTSNSHQILNQSTITSSLWRSQIRPYYARGSRVHYLDFRHRLPTNHRRSHLLIIRRQKMKKHQKRKWRKKYKSVLAKTRLKREISKEKMFRVELLSMIRQAEQFDPEEYALRKIHEMKSVVQSKTKEESLEELKELIRINRYQTDYIKPKHRRLETFGLLKPILQDFSTNTRKS